MRKTPKEQAFWDAAAIAALGGIAADPEANGNLTEWAANRADDLLEERRRRMEDE